MLERLKEKNRAFIEDLFAPASPLPLAVLRITIATVLLVQAALLAPDVLDLYGSSGLLQRGLRAFLLTPVLPLYVDLFKISTKLGLAPDTLIRVAFLAYVGALTWLLVGFHSRAACVVAWGATFLLKMNLGYNSSYGVDTFAHIFLFYLMFMPMNRALSLDRYLGFVEGDAGEWQRISLHILRFQLFVVYCSSGIDKGVGPQWWNGEAIWRALMLPQFTVFDMSWLAWHPYLAKLTTWGTLFIEVGYPILLGFRRTRKIGALAVISMHLGIAVSMRLVTFALFMIALTGSLFLVPDEEGRRKKKPGPSTRPGPGWNYLDQPSGYRRIPSSRSGKRGRAARRA